VQPELGPRESLQLCTCLFLCASANKIGFVILPLLKTDYEGQFLASCKTRILGYNENGSTCAALCEIGCLITDVKYAL